MTSECDQTSKEELCEGIMVDLITYFDSVMHRDELSLGDANDILIASMANLYKLYLQLQLTEALL